MDISMDIHIHGKPGMNYRSDCNKRFMHHTLTTSFSSQQH